MADLIPTEQELKRIAKSRENKAKAAETKRLNQEKTREFVRKSNKAEFDSYLEEEVRKVSENKRKALLKMRAGIDDTESEDGNGDSEPATPPPAKPSAKPAAVRQTGARK